MTKDEKNKIEAITKLVESARANLIGARDIVRYHKDSDRYDSEPLFQFDDVDDIEMLARDATAYVDRIREKWMK